METRHCWRQSIQNWGPKVFLLIFALKKHAVHNAITSINNSLIQSNYVNWRYKFRIVYPKHFYNCFE